MEIIIKIRTVARSNSTKHVEAKGKCEGDDSSIDSLIVVLE